MNITWPYRRTEAFSVPHGTIKELLTVKLLYLLHYTTERAYGLPSTLSSTYKHAGDLWTPTHFNQIWRRTETSSAWYITRQECYFEALYVDEGQQPKGDLWTQDCMFPTFSVGGGSKFYPHNSPLNARIPHPICQNSYPSCLKFSSFSHLGRFIAPPIPLIWYASAPPQLPPLSGMPMPTTCQLDVVHKMYKSGWGEHRFLVKISEEWGPMEEVLTPIPPPLATPLGATIRYPGGGGLV